MQWQYEWAGTQLVNKRVLVHPDELDRPNRQLGTIFIPPDPLPIPNARPEGYPIDELWPMIVETPMLEGALPVYLENATVANRDNEIALSLETSSLT